MANLYRKGDHDTRPWGTWEVLDGADDFCVKRIMVNPKSMLSLQLHHHRSEHWIIVKGEAFVTLNEKIIPVTADDAIYIPKETKHRIENKSDTPMEFIEIQTGDNLDENDIVRFEDIYGRV
ncbi:MAG TPA: mannose-6-phosphate isomerase [Alphaproteobacteria bacterium]|nr:mannose-6-phosphate isomerase [Alphaproteobacteria bacterium]